MLNSILEIIMICNQRSDLAITMWCPWRKTTVSRCRGFHSLLARVCYTELNTMLLFNTLSCMKLNIPRLGVQLHIN